MYDAYLSEVSVQLHIGLFQTLNLSRVVGGDGEHYLLSGQDYPMHNSILLCTKQQKWIKMGNIQCRVTEFGSNGPYINSYWKRFEIKSIAGGYTCYSVQILYMIVYKKTCEKPACFSASGVCCCQQELLLVSHRSHLGLQLAAVLIS